MAGEAELGEGANFSRRGCQGELEGTNFDFSDPFRQHALSEDNRF